MGISASNHNIPVFFNKKSGVFFNYHPKSHHCEDSLEQNVTSPLCDPCSNFENSFFPMNFHQSKPKISPKRNINLGSRDDGIRYNSKVCSNFEENYDERLLEEKFQVNYNSDLESDSFIMPQWDEDHDIHSICDSFSFDESMKSQETSSLRANFSPASLKERYLKAESYFLHEKALSNLKFGQLTFESEKSGVLSDSHIVHIKGDTSSADSLSNISDYLLINDKRVKKLLHQDISVDSEASDFSFDLKTQSSELGYQTVDQLEQLQNQLHEVKQAVLELDKDFDELKIYETPPKHSWELSAISPSDMDQSSWSDNGKDSIAAAIKKNYESKIVLEKKIQEQREIKKQVSILNSLSSDSNQCLKEVPMHSSVQFNSEICNCNQTDINCSSDEKNLKIMTSFPKTQNTENLDCESDIGNSLESELGEISENGGPCSLEWDPMCLPESVSVSDDCQSFPSPTDTLASLSEFLPDQEVYIISPLSKNKNVKDFHQNYIISWKKCHRSRSFPSGISILGINKTIIKNNLISKKNVLKRSMTLPYCRRRRTEIESIYERQLDFSNIMREKSLFSLKYPYENSMYSSEESGFLDNLIEHKKQTNTSINELSIYSSTSNIQNNNFNEKYAMHLSQDTNGNCLETENQSSTSIEMMNQSLNRDSAYCDESFSDKNINKNISPKQNLISYSLHEWKEETSKNKQIQKGFMEIKRILGVDFLHVIHNDNYCVIRATLFQVLSQGLPVLYHHGSVKLIYQKLQRWINGPYPWLSEWNFGNKLSCNGNKYLQGFYKCLHALHNLEEDLKQCTCVEDYLMILLNSDSDLDICLMEAIKILMMVTIIELHESLITNEIVPVFVMILFARNTSLSLQEFIFNHLNCVGDTTRLEQVDLYLLGYTLSVVLKIFKPYNIEQEDFVCCYPEKNWNGHPEVVLIAEDDGHYLIPRG